MKKFDGSCGSRCDKARERGKTSAETGGSVAVAPENTAQQLEAEVRRFKEQSGRPVIGYLCCFAPPEIIAAAGAIPFRILGRSGEDNSAADAYVEPYGCTYVRNILSRAANGNLDFMDGLVISHSCDMVQRLYGIWTYYHPFDYSYLFNVPHQVSPPSQRFFKRELAFFQESLEKFTGVEVTDGKLRRAIEAYNRNRSLVRELYRLREPGVRPGKGPGIKGSEVLELLMAGGALPEDHYYLLLESALADYRNRSKNGGTEDVDDQTEVGAEESRPASQGGLSGEPTGGSRRPRVLVWGSIIDDPAFYRMIENAGADVVADDTCVGFRTWDQDVPLADDLYEGLKDHYLLNFQCPRTDRGPGTARFDYILQRARAYEVDGVIGYTISFCDPHKFDYPDLRDYLKAEGLPMLLIDDNYSFEPSGAIETRLQAFIEML